MPAPDERDSDPFRPPKIPTEVHCLHCDKTYESYLIHWEEFETDEGVRGFWCCPTPGCDGKGFGFDIFPTDKEYRNEQGEKMWFDDDEEPEFFGDADDDDPEGDSDGDGSD